MAATMEEEELGPAAALWEPERARMARVYYAGPGQPPGRRHPPVCPRGPVATGLGPDWSEERDVAGAGLERVEGADIRRAGPNGPRASNVSLGANDTLIPVTGVIGDNGIFPVTDRTFFKRRIRLYRCPITGNVCNDCNGYNQSMYSREN